MKYLLSKTCLLLVVSSLLMAGCAGSPITLNSISTKDIVQTKSRPISGEACGFQLLLLIPISINSRLERAFVDLKKNAGADGIANLSIEESWKYALIGTVYCTKLNAVAYKINTDN